MIQRFSNHQNDRIPAPAKAITAKVETPPNPFQSVLRQVKASPLVVAKEIVSPYEQDVKTTLIGGASVPNNPLQFATADAATALAKKLGGEVREDNMSGTFSRSAPQRMITVAGGNAINAGLAAGLLAFYGDAPDSEAWRIINRDLGRGKS